MRILSGYAYRIKNKSSDLLLSVATVLPMGVVIQEAYAQDEPTQLKQMWYAYSVGDAYLFINKSSGLLLNISERCVNSPTVQSELEHYEHHTQTWSVSEVSVDEGPYHRVKNEAISLFLTAQGTESGTTCLQRNLAEDTPENDSQLWEFIAADNVANTTEFSWNTNGNEEVPNFTRMTSLVRPAPSRSEEVLMGRMLIPFVLVNDPELNRQEQLEKSPFYELRRYCSWEMVHYHEHNGEQEKIEAVPVTVGLLSGPAGEMQSVIGFSVGWDSRIRVKESVCMLLRNKIGEQLRIQCMPGTITENTREMHETVRYIAGPRRNYALWSRNDRYRLIRRDLVEVLEWSNTGPITALDIFPGHPLN